MPAYQRMYGSPIMMVTSIMPTTGISMLVDVCQAQRDFDVLLDKMLDGDDIVIARDGIPVARLVAVEAKSPAQKVRLGGLNRVDLGLSPDFHLPMTDEDLLGGTG